MTADDIDDDDDFPALREQLGCARLHPGTLCGKKPFHVHELSSVDNDSDVDVKMGLDVDVDVDVANDCMVYISVYKGTNLKIYGSRVTRH